MCESRPPTGPAVGEPGTDETLPYCSVYSSLEPLQPCPRRSVQDVFFPQAQPHGTCISDRSQAPSVVALIAKINHIVDSSAEPRAAFPSTPYSRRDNLRTAPRSRPSPPPPHPPLPPSDVWCVAQTTASVAQSRSPILATSSRQHLHSASHLISSPTGPSIAAHPGAPLQASPLSTPPLLPSHPHPPSPCRSTPRLTWPRCRATSASDRSPGTAPLGQAL